MTRRAAQDGRRVGVGADPDARYPDAAPFDPVTAYPELVGIARAADGRNGTYAAVREALVNAGFDASHAGTADWNPFGAAVRPGMRVLIHPDLGTGATSASGEAIDATHGSVVRVVLDYVLRALEGRGEIWIGDAPAPATDFAQVCRTAGLADVADEARGRTGVRIHLVDLRAGGAIEPVRASPRLRRSLHGDPNGFVVVDLASRSLLASLDEGPAEYRVPGFERDDTRSHHGPGRHEYLLSRTALLADVIVSVPKLRTHSRAGLGAVLASAAGLCADAAWLPLYRAGSPAEGGDAYLEPSHRKSHIDLLDAEAVHTSPGLRRRALDVARRALRATESVVGFDDPFHAGMWWGNDTAWRALLDARRAVQWLYDGAVVGAEPKPWLCVVDAIVCCEGEGADPAPAGRVFAGSDAAMVDLACAYAAHLDPSALPILVGAFDVADLPVTPHPPADIVVVPGIPEIRLAPSRGWAQRVGACAVR